MKKHFKKFIAGIMLSAIFCLTGCMPNVTLDPPSDDIMGAAGDADNIMKTANNVTYYYEDPLDLQKDAGKDAVDRNPTVSVFSDAYIFVDPGYSHQFNDHITNTDYAFYQLVDRQISTLASIVGKKLMKIYYSSTTEDLLKNMVTGVSYVGTHITTTPDNFELTAINTMNVASVDLDGEEGNEILGVGDLVSGELNLNNIAILSALTGITQETTATDNVEPFLVGSLTLELKDGSNNPYSYEVTLSDAAFLNFERAMLGGKEFVEVPVSVDYDPNDGNGSRPYTGKYYNFSTDQLNSDLAWTFTNGASSGDGAA